MSKDRNCAVCVFCLRQDYGYSNWTTEGTTLHCLLALNPTLDGLEEAYGDPTPEVAAALDVAEACERFTQGTPTWLDVDHKDLPHTEPEGGYTDEMLGNYASPEAIPALREWLKGGG